MSNSHDSVLDESKNDKNSYQSNSEIDDMDKSVPMKLNKSFDDEMEI